MPDIPDGARSSAAPSTEAAALLADLAADRDAIAADILDLVRVESHSLDVAALDRCAEAARALAVRLLGAPDREERVSGAAQDRGDVLALTYAGTGPGHVVLLGHYDTVWPTGTLADWPAGPGPAPDAPDGADDQLDPQGRPTLTGPGILDMKSGVVQGFWALAALRRQSASGQPIPTVTYVLTGDEEVGSYASRSTVERICWGVDATLVLEPSADGHPKSERKGTGLTRVGVIGVEAHSGLEPEKGASAVHALAEAVGQFVAAARPDLGTTVNVGVIGGGSGANVVAGEATALVDIRVTRPEEPARIDAAFAAVQPRDERVSIAIETDWSRPPMVLTEDSRALLRVVQEAGAALGRRLGHVSVGGASDANFVCALGKPVLCGLGAVGAGPHARHEHILLDAIPSQTALVAESLRRLAGGLP